MVLMISRSRSFTSCRTRKGADPLLPERERQPVMLPSPFFSAPLYMQVSSSPAKERCSIHSIRREVRPAAGAALRYAAPAPSESIQRRKSASKQWLWFAASSAPRSGVTASNSSARMKLEASSEPVATALPVVPEATFSAAYFSALIPERQMPDMLATSHGALPSSPCTIRPCPGMSWSGEEVPQARHSIWSGVKPSWGARRRTASAVSAALLWVIRPVPGSMA